MVKTPKTRHSGSSRAPVTIDLEADKVSRPDGEEAGAQKPEETLRETGPAQAVKGQAPPAPKSDRADEPGVQKKSAPSPDPKPEPKPEPVQRGGAGLVAAGVVGGIIALAGAAGLQYAGLVNTPQQAAAVDYSDQIAQLRTQISDLAAVSSDADAAAQLKDLDGAISQLKSELASLKETVGADTAIADTHEALAALSQRVGQVETSVGALDEASALQPADLAPLNNRIAALEQQLRTADEAEKEQQSRLETLDQSLDAVSAKLEEQAGQPMVALAIAASALKSAVERGEPFDAELETFAAIVPGAVSLDTAHLAALRAQAQKGVAARSKIAAQVGAAADAMVAADNPVDENAGFVQRLMSSAQSLVKVRPIGAVEGAGVPETVARLEADVIENNYAGALAEYDTLPEGVKAAGADFAAMLKARVDAQAAVDALVSQSMSKSEG